MYYILNARTAKKVMIDPFNTLDEACNMAVSYSINIRDPIDVVTEVGGSKFTTPHRQHYTHYHLGKEISANKRKDLLKMIPRKKKS